MVMIIYQLNNRCVKRIFDKIKDKLINWTRTIKLKKLNKD